MALFLHVGPWTLVFLHHSYDKGLARHCPSSGTACRAFQITGLEFSSK